MRKVKLSLLILLVLFFQAVCLKSLYAYKFDFVTVGDVVKHVRDKFASVETYQAAFVMVSDNQGRKTRQTGTIRYMAPDKMLLEFSQPSGQRIVSNGRTMWVYIPSMNVVAEQDLKAEGGIFSAASRSGLTRLFTRYHYRFASKDQPVKQSDGSKQYVLHLRQRETRAGLREIMLYINEQYFITRAEGETASGKKIELTFSNIQTGIDIPGGMFKFDAPARARVIRNPMLSEE